MANRGGKDPIDITVLERERGKVERLVGELSQNKMHLFNSFSQNFITERDF